MSLTVEIEGNEEYHKKEKSKIITGIGGKLLSVERQGELRFTIALKNLLFTFLLKFH